MRKVLVLFSVLIGLALLVTAASAGTAPYPRSPEDWTIADGGAGVAPNESAPLGWGPIYNNAPQVGDEDRTLFNIEGVADQSSGSSLSFSSIAGPNYGSLTGLAYGLKVVAENTTTVAGVTTLYVYLGSFTGNPNTSGSWVVYNNGATTAGSEKNLFNPGGTGLAPTYWASHAGLATYPGAGSSATSSLFLDGTFVNEGTIGGQAYCAVETLTLTGPDAGEGEIGSAPDLKNGITLSITGGNPNAVATFGGVGNTITFKPDLYFPPEAPDYEGSSQDAGSWQVESDDSFGFTVPGTATGGTVTVAGQTFTTLPGDTVKGSTQDASSLYVPEPMAAIFFGTGLVGIAGYLSRRRMLRQA
jgi:hypothetical protein